MRSRAIVAAIVAAISGVASAQPRVEPAQPTHEEKGGRVSYGEPKDRKQDAPRGDGDWVQLASPTPAKHGTEFVVVGKEQGDFAQLRVDATTGKTVVLRIRVYFTDGKMKSMDFDRKVDPQRTKSILFDLGTPKPIDRVVVTTETYTNGTYTLYGSSGTGTAVVAR